MTEKDAETHLEEDVDELDSKLNYKPPPQKSLKELQEMDKDDESLIKYKKTLLGDGPVVAGVWRGMGGRWKAYISATQEQVQKKDYPVVARAKQVRHNLYMLHKVTDHRMKYFGEIQHKSAWK